MKFTKIEPHENMNTICFRSDCQLWDVGLYRVIFGYRVALGHVNDGYELSICVGNDSENAKFVLAAIFILIENVESDRKSVLDFCSQFPTQIQRPLKIGDPLYLSIMNLLSAKDRTCSEH
jgi:hypothetical protein